MKNFWQRGASFFKILLVLTIVVVLICVAVPSVKTVAGQSGARACENNIATIDRLENEYYKQIGRHTDEYQNLEFVDEDSDLYKAGLLSEDDIACKQTEGQYQWQEVDGIVVLVCTGHQHEN